MNVDVQARMNMYRCIYKCIVPLTSQLSSVDISQYTLITETPSRNTTL